VLADEHLARLDRFELPLYKFQREGVRYILARRRVLLADEPGLGKTLDALASIVASERSLPWSWYRSR
jgi:MoxR-like ATPase